MPTPAIALKLKRFRRNFGIAAPKVVVRTRLPWQWGGLAIALVASVFAGISLFYKTSEVHLLDRELEVLRHRIEQQEDELSLLRVTAGTGQNAVRMEKSAQQQLLGRIKALEGENAALKEEIRLFERLIPAPSEEVAVRVESFRVQQEGDGRFRYRLLLVYQPGKQAPEFRGRLEFVVLFSLSGKEQKLVLPGSGVAGGGGLVEIRRFLRREGLIELSPGARVKEVEVRVLSGDTLRAKRLAEL